VLKGKYIFTFGIRLLPQPYCELLAYIEVFLLKKCHFLPTTTPLDIKTCRCFCFGHGLYASACQILPSYDTVFRKR